MPGRGLLRWTDRKGSRKLRKGGGSSLFLSLVIVPVIYYLIERGRNRMGVRW
jgi:hypothetical protein